MILTSGVEDQYSNSFPNTIIMCKNIRHLATNKMVFKDADPKNNEMET